jgi:hypothetical protein
MTVRTEHPALAANVAWDGQQAPPVPRKVRSVVSTNTDFAADPAFLFAQDGSSSFDGFPVSLAGSSCSDCASGPPSGGLTRPTP